ncbi:MAG: VWA domain-containing protein [Bacteroidetes bacterium]|nr:VWA domain-containing protein [Bacteroidota bacterium]
MYKFANIEYFYALLLIPVLMLLYVLMMRWKKRALDSFGDSNVVMKLMPDYSSKRGKWKAFFQISAFTFMVLALTGPQMGSRLEEIKRKGVDLVIALDISNSMLAEDLSPTRLERAKRAMLQLIDNLKGDRIGIVVFAGEAYVQLPITTDYGAAKMFINTINTEIIQTQGTAIGTAINLAVRSFGEKTDDKKSRVIMVVSDGEDHQDDPVEAAKNAASEGIIIHTIGFGSPQGSPIPYFINGNNAGFRKDNEGNTVVTKLDEETMQKIAASANGMYVRATNAEAGLNIIMDEISQMEKSEFSSKMFSDFESQFQYFVAMALLLLMLDFFMPERKGKWAGKFNIFGEKKAKTTPFLSSKSQDKRI